jgi:hypothetical protein
MDTTTMSTRSTGSAGTNADTAKSTGNR